MQARASLHYSQPAILPALHYSKKKPVHLVGLRESEAHPVHLASCATA